MGSEGSELRLNSGPQRSLQIGNLILGIASVEM